MYSAINYNQLQPIINGSLTPNIGDYLGSHKQSIITERLAPNKRDDLGTHIHFPKAPNVGGKSVLNIPNVGENSSYEYPQCRGKPSLNSFIIILIKAPNVGDKKYTLNSFVIILIKVPNVGAKQVLKAQAE